MLRKWKQMLHSGYFVRLLWMVLLSIIAALVVFAAVIYTSYGTLYLSSLSSRGQTTAAEICGGLESALMDYSTAVDELAAGEVDETVAHAVAAGGRRAFAAAADVRLQK